MIKINFHNLLKPFVKSKVKHIFIQGLDLKEKNSHLVIAALCDFARKNKCYIMIETKKIKNMKLNTYENTMLTLIDLNLIGQEYNTIFVNCKDGCVFVEALTPGSINNTLLEKYERY